jgi:predicted transcriptional regulator
MVSGSSRAGIILALLCLIPAVSAVSATPLVYGDAPGQMLSDPTPLNVWNVPLKIVALEILSIAAPAALFIPIQLLFSLSAWLYLGHRRVSDRNVLDNQVRNVIYVCIRENPGIQRAVLARLLQTNIGTVRYHVDVLCRTRKVVAGQNGKKLRYYANGETCSDLEKKVAGYLAEGPKSAILDVVVQCPGSTRKDIASSLAMSGPDITWHMRTLIEDGIVRSERSGRNVRYDLCPDAKEYFILHASGKSGLGAGT